MLLVLIGGSLSRLPVVSPDLVKIYYVEIANKVVHVKGPNTTLYIDIYRTIKTF